MVIPKEVLVVPYRIPSRIPSSTAVRRPFWAFPWLLERRSIQRFLDKAPLFPLFYIPCLVVLICLVAAALTLDRVLYVVYFFIYPRNVLHASYQR